MYSTPVFYSYVHISVVKSLERALGTVRWFLTLDMIFFVKSLSAPGNLPLLMSCIAMEFAKMGHGVDWIARPVNLLMICRAHQLE